MRIPTLLLLSAIAIGLVGCAAGDPNVEGAKLDLRNGDYEAALNNIETALETNPSNPEAYLLRVEVLRQQYENTPGAQPKRAILAETYDLMVSSFDRAAELLPAEDPRVDQARLAVWALGVNAGNDIIRDPDADVTEAIGYFRRTTELYPDSSQGYLGLGLSYLRDGNATEAIGPLAEGVEAAPDDAVLAYYYGRALVLADRPSEAITFLEGVQDRFPEDEDIQTMLLNAYSLAGETDRAIERYAEAVERQPDNGALRYNYGALLLQAERFDEAIVQLQTATELDPANSDAFYNLGAAYQNKAAALNEQANETEDVDAANALIDERNENLELALAPLMEARAISAGTPDEPGVCDALFRVYTQLGRVDEAEGVAECAGISMN